MNDHLLTALSRCYGALDRRAQLLVLTFHRAGAQHAIHELHAWEELSFLARHYETVTPRQLQGRPSGRRVAMVTVDDCYGDVHEVIFPLARRLGIPITLCVPTDFFLRGRWLWGDKIGWCVKHAGAGRAWSIQGDRYAVGDGQEATALVERLKKETPLARDALIERLLSDLGLKLPMEPPAESRPLEQAAMTEMLSSGLVELCAHSVTHPILTLVDEERLEYEAVRSKRELEEFSGREVISFCYPNGLEGDFDGRTGRALRNAGYKMAFTSVEGLNRPVSINWFALRRVHAQTRYSVFLKLASGLGEFQRRVMQARRRGDGADHKPAEPSQAAGQRRADG